MAYHSRLSADPEYLRALGQALYSFTWTEWVVIYTIVALNRDTWDAVPKGETAAKIARALEQSIKDTTLPLDGALRKDLGNFAEGFRTAIRSRNKLLHAHPYTAGGGTQQLGGGGVEWSMSEVEGAIELFETVGIRGNDIFHGPLKHAKDAVMNLVPK